MTPPQTELEKAIEQSEAYRSRRWMVPQTIVETLLLAAKRIPELEQQLKAMTIERDCWIYNTNELQKGYNKLEQRVKEVEKENKSLNDDLDSILTDVNYEGGVQYWMKNSTSLMKDNLKILNDLSTLRTEYKKALQLLEHCRYEYNISDNLVCKTCNHRKGEGHSDVCKSQTVLSSPSAIAARKDEV